MKRRLDISLLCLLAFFACDPRPSRQPDAVLVVDRAQIQVHFSPEGSPTAAVVDAVDGARSSVLVQAYVFTSAPIAEALRRAHRRGVNVQVILDKSQLDYRYTVATFLRNAGIPVYIDRKHAIAHNKVMVIDDRITITGSFNFTRAGEERNSENLLVITDEAIARLYRENWDSCRGHSEKY